MGKLAKTLKGVKTGLASRAPSTQDKAPTPARGGATSNVNDLPEQSASNFGHRSQTAYPVRGK